MEADDQQVKRVAAVAKAVEAACRAWRIGRGKHVDRRALQDSDCVSDGFINELTDLAKRVNGDAETLIEALERGEVSRWWKKNTESLREFFEENGFLSADNSFQPDEIRVRVLAAVADDLSERRLETTLVDRIVGSLPASAAQQRHAAAGAVRRS